LVILKSVILNSIISVKEEAYCSHAAVCNGITFDLIVSAEESEYTCAIIGQCIIKDSVAEP